MAKTEGRKVTMLDGRVVEFGEKQRMDKSYSASGSLVTVAIDFDNGETVQVEVDANTPVGLQALGHGLVQKLGDAAAGANTTADAFESVLEIAQRISKGEWSKVREGGTGVAKGASELVEALVKVLGQSKEVVREMLGKLSQGDKMELRKVPRIAAVIEEIKASRAPSAAEQAKAEAAAQLLEALGRGETPVYPPSEDDDVVEPEPAPM